MEKEKILWEEKIWKPFRQKYFIEAILQAQKVCVMKGRALLMYAIVKQLKAPISGGMLQDIINNISEKRLWILLKRFRLIDKSLVKTLLDFNGIRNEFTHEFLYGFTHELSLLKHNQEDIKKILKKMEDSYHAISRELKK